MCASFKRSFIGTQVLPEGVPCQVKWLRDSAIAAGAQNAELDQIAVCALHAPVSSYGAAVVQVLLLRDFPKKVSQR